MFCSRYKWSVYLYHGIHKVCITCISSSAAPSSVKMNTKTQKLWDYWVASSANEQMIFFFFFRCRWIGSPNKLLCVEVRYREVSQDTYRFIIHLNYCSIKSDKKVIFFIRERQGKCCFILFLPLLCSPAPWRWNGFKWKSRGLTLWIITSFMKRKYN